MKIKKILLIMVIVVVVLVIVAVVAVGLNLDRIVKSGVETYGPQITKVTVKLDAVNIGLFTGSAKIKGLEVGNPEGYTSPHSITAGLISVGVDSGSLLSDKIVVRSIRVEAPEITFEGGLMKNNLTKLLDNLSDTNAPAINAPAATGPGKKLQVDDLLVTGAKVNIVGIKTLTIPEIHLTALGQGADGITAQDLTRRLLQEVISITLKEVASSGLTKGVEKATSEVMGKATKGLNDLFKKKE